MSIFQKSILDVSLKDVNTNNLQRAFEVYRNNYSDTEKISNIENINEQSYKEGFLRDNFVSYLGYTINPEPNYNLTTEFKNLTSSKKVDGAIVKAGKVLAAIELKSYKTHSLESIETQAFGYKNNHPTCRYIITSNFRKLRFYIDYSNEYEEFDLFNLSSEDFKLLYLLLNKESIFNDLPLKIKQKSKFHEQNITSELYKDYSKLRENIFENLVKNNSHYDKLLLYRKTQNLLDRIIFILFAEDCGLIPTNTITNIINRFKNLKKEDAYKPLYEIYKQFFKYLNEGNKSQGFSKYNGGLFAPDEVLDNLRIDDEVLLDDSPKLSEYDFNSEVDVNILGHIFEHSLSEIEEMEQNFQAKQEPSQKKNPKNKFSNKRKKDGVFYTPKYITQYIVENTIGSLCRDKRKELEINSISPDNSHFLKKSPRGKIRLSEKGKNLLAKLENYKKWLLSLKILDPACGSGAFLNQALQFLLKEHKTNDEHIAKLTGDSLGLFDTDKQILENNLYGVDINQESIEIAKLSLWLRTAQKGRKLSKLSNNIKCGNSLISAPKIVGDLAFDWQSQFPEIMQNGGFDAIIGNPPYIKEYTNRLAFEGLKDNPCYQGKMDLWYFFGTLALELIKKETGLIGYIAPNNWITNAGAKKFRNIILENAKLKEFIDFGDYKIFQSAGIQTMIYIMQASKNNDKYKLKYSKLLDKKAKPEDVIAFLSKNNLNKDPKFENFITEINKTKYRNQPITFIKEKFYKIIQKIQHQHNFTLNENEVANGIHPHHDYVKKNMLKILGETSRVGEGIFAITRQKAKDLNLSQEEQELLKPYYNSSNFGRYYASPETEQLIIYTTSKFKNPRVMEKYPNLKKHLDKFREVITSDNKPYGLHRAREEKFFKGEKIIATRKCTNRPIFTYTNFPSYVSATFYIIKTNRIKQKFLIAILNSKLIAFWLKNMGKMQGDNYQLDKEPLLSLPLIKPSETIQNKLEQLVDELIKQKEMVADYQKLLTQAQSENLYDREIELDKKLKEIKEKIYSLETEIEKSVYELYNLNQDEIAIIENVI